MIDCVGIELKADRFLVVGPTPGRPLYLERRPFEVVPVKLTWCARWYDATPMTLEDAVHYCVQMEDCWVEEIVQDYWRIPDVGAPSWTYCPRRVNR